MPDPVALLRAYKPDGKRLILAGRISGDAKSAFPDGPPKKAEASGGAAATTEAAKPAAPGSDGGAAKSGAASSTAPGTAPGDDAAKHTAAAPASAVPAAGAAAAGGVNTKETAKDATTASAKDKEAAPVRPHKASGRVAAIVVADSDMLTDQFWVDVRDFLGQQVAIPNAGNAAFVVNALENLSGSEALISLRGRGTDNRPFQLVEELRRDAERRYREKEQVLTGKLKEVQDQLAKYESAGEGGTAILSESDRQAIEKFRADMLTIRRELREVKLALREDIDRLDGWLRFANIGLVPLLIALGGGGWALLRRRKPRAPSDQGGVS
jgi:ABC-type uncharacterized transport system involved in gliding motility auxiliary subunit